MLKLPTTAQLLMIICLFTSLNSMSDTWKKEALSIVDVQYMQKQRDSINELTRSHFGRQLNGEQNNDFALIQRLLDEQIINADQRELLQALGVVFGDIFKKQHGLSWIIYIDQYGRSRALDVPRQEDVLFPITMISRRVEAGLKVSIDDINQKAEKSLAQIKQQIIVY